MQPSLWGNARIYPQGICRTQRVAPRRDPKRALLGDVPDDSARVPRGEHLVRQCARFWLTATPPSLPTTGPWMLRNTVTLTGAAPRTLIVSTRVSNGRHVPLNTCPVSRPPPASHRGSR